MNGLRMNWWMNEDWKWRTGWMDEEVEEAFAQSTDPNIWRTNSGGQGINLPFSLLFTYIMMSLPIFSTLQIQNKKIIIRMGNQHLQLVINYRIVYHGCRPGSANSPCLHSIVHPSIPFPRQSYAALWSVLLPPGQHRIATWTVSIQKTRGFFCRKFRAKHKMSNKSNLGYN
jgi:hypothetical protein